MEYSELGERDGKEYSGLRGCGAISLLHFVTVVEECKELSCCEGALQLLHSLRARFLSSHQLICLVDLISLILWLCDAYMDLALNEE